MNNPEPTIRINVDATNPGQFFACCGLLELADRLWLDHEVLGCFGNNVFELRAKADDFSLDRLVDQFVGAELRVLNPSDKAASPLWIGSAFGLRLDWWQKIEVSKKVRVDLGGGEQMMTWSGSQRGPLIFRLMREACSGLRSIELLDAAVAVYDTVNGKMKKKTTSPFYFDARRGETSLDVGFSADEQEMSVMTYPAVESLALVGLQRFRPAVDESRRIPSFLYTAWTEPLPATVAATVVCAAVPSRSSRVFRFTKPSRGGEYLTMFSRATRERNSDV